MAGPGIRYHFMATELAKHFSVTVGFFEPSYLPNDDFKRTYDVKSIDAYQFESGFKDVDTVIALWLSDSMINYCNEHEIFTVFDMYAPVPVESLASHIYNTMPGDKSFDFEFVRSNRMYRVFFENGDLFLCSNRRQLDYWNGFIFGSGIVKPSLYHKRPFFDRMVYAPMGIDSRAELKNRSSVMRGVLPGVTDHDKIMVWTGGVWGWYDGAVLMHAMKLLATSRPDIKLVFFGTEHPNPSVPKMKESYNTRKLAEELGLIDKTVFFKDGWVAYEDRIDYLLEADIAINTHKPSMEAEFSHRTRVLDHILAKLPTICTTGDYLSDDVIARQGLGIAVEPNNEQALAKAITEIFIDKNYSSYKNNIANVRDSFDWAVTLQPLVQALLEDLPRLNRIPSIEPDLGRRRLIRKFKHLVPLPIKKVIIRAFYGK